MGNNPLASRLLLPYFTSKFISTSLASNVAAIVQDHDQILKILFLLGLESLG